VPKWNVVALLNGVAAESAASEVSAAADEIAAALSDALPPEWSVGNVSLDPAFAVGDWVLVRVQGPDEYARVVLDGGELKAQTGSGELRPLRAVVRRM
jgi:hypothetical protein